MIRRNHHEAETGIRELQLRYVGLITGFTVVMMLALGIALTLRGRGVVVEMVRKEQLSVAQAGANAIGAFFGDIADELERVSRDQAVLSSPGIAREVLIMESGDASTFRALHVFRRNSELYASSGVKAARITEIKEDECFDTVITGGSTFCLSNAHDLDTDKPKAFAMAPVVDNLGDVKYVIVGEIGVGAGIVAETVNGIQPGKHGFAFLVDASGSLVWSGGKGDSHKVTDYASLRPVKEAREGRRGTVEYVFNRTKTLASFYPVPKTDWTLVAQRPARDASSGAGEMIVILVLFLAVGGIGSLALAVALSQNFARFIFALSGRMESVARGDLNQSIEPAVNKELMPIADTFNRMLDTIRAGKANQESSYRELLGTARFHQSLLESIRDFLVVIDSGLRVLHISGTARLFCSGASDPGARLSELGASWSQQRFIDAVREVVIQGGDKRVDGIHFMHRDGSAALFRLNIQPLTDGASGRREGALISGMEITDDARQLNEKDRSGRFYRGLVDGSPTAILLLDEDKKIEWWNAAAVEALALKEDAGGGDFAALLTPRSVSLFGETFKRTLRDGTTLPAWEMEVTDGEKTFLVETQLSRIVVPGGKTRIALYGRRMPSRRVFEKEAYEGRPALEKKIQYLRGTLDGVAEPVAMVDRRGAIVTVNSRFEDFVKQQRQTLGGKTFTDFLRDAPAAILPEAVIQSGAAVYAESRWNPGAGQDILCLVTAAPLFLDHGRIEGVVYLVREVGTAHQAEEHKLYQARTAAVRDTARHIVSRIDPSISQLQDSLLELGANIFSDANRGVWKNAAAALRTIMNSLNNLRLFATETRPRFELCRVDELLDEVVDAAVDRDMIPSGVTIEREYDEEPLEVHADSEQIKMVAWQLLVNAFQAVNGAGAIFVRAVRRDIAGRKAVLVEVWNESRAVDERDMGKVFDPFRGATEGGMGLGLSLCRRVVQNHGGRIGMERQDDFIRVSFYIPIDDRN